MTRLHRRLLFYGLVAVFLMLASWLTLTARGFSLDFESRTVAERGAIFLRAEPPGGSVYLDGERFEPPTGILRTQAFITNLPPAPHEVVVVRDGYHRWQKTFVVRPLEVAEASTIRLIPRAPSIHRIGPISPISPIGRATSTAALFSLETKRRQLPETASSTLATVELRPTSPISPIGQISPVSPIELRYRDLLLSLDGKKVLVRTKNELWVVWLQKERANGLHQPGDVERIISEESEITDALWLPDDSHHVIFAVGGPPTPLGTGKIKIAELDGRGGRNVVDLLEAEEVKFFIDPESSELLFASKTDFFRLIL